MTRLEIEHSTTLNIETTTRPEDLAAARRAAAGVGRLPTGGAGTGHPVSGTLGG